MPSWVGCENGHWGGRCREAAIKIAKNGALGKCSVQGCDSDVHYVVTLTFSNSGETHRYELIKVFRTSTDSQVEENEYDPMIFLLSHLESKELTIWSWYWTVSRKRTWHVGQFPPLLTVDNFRDAFNYFELEIKPK